MNERTKKLVRDFVAARLAVIPAQVTREPNGHHAKRPCVPKLAALYDNPPNEDAMRALFAAAPDANAVAILCGAASGNLAALDFDAGGRAYAPWAEKVPHEILTRLVIEKTVSGGYHIYVRAPGANVPSEKLAMTADGAVLIETRCARSLSVCQPTPGYDAVQGTLADIPMLTDAELTLLLDAARSLDETPTPATAVPVPSWDEVRVDADDDRPGSDFNRRGQEEFLAWLETKGWKVTGRSGENIRLLRPGKDGRGVSADFNGSVLYNFSTSVEGLPAGRGYSMFHVFARLEHGGDFKAAAAALAERGFGGVAATVARVESVAESDDDESAAPAIEDPGLISADLLAVPGLIDEIARYTLVTSSRSCPVFASTGAICLVAHLTGLARCRTAYGDRPNLYALMLGPSASGKSFPQRTNRKFARALGIGNSMVSNVGSGQGLEDAFIRAPQGVLFTLDEMQKFLGAMRGTDNANAEGISKTLLEMYSASADVYYTRRLALPAHGRAPTARPDSFDNPHLTVHASGIPELVFQNLSADNLTDGLLGRFLLFETDARGEANDDCREDALPRATIEKAAAFIRGYDIVSTALPPWIPGGAAGDVGKVVPLDDEAKALRAEFGKEADRRFDAATGDDRAAAQALWGRALEKAMKLALVFAVSVQPETPVITGDVLRRAWAVAEHATRRLLFLAATYTARGEYDAMAKRILRFLREARRPLSRSVLVRKMHESTKDLEPVFQTLVETKQIFISQEKSGGGRRPTLIGLVK